MTLCIPAKVLLHVWSYDFYDMTLSTGKQRRHMIKQHIKTINLDDLTPGSNELFILVSRHMPGAGLESTRLGDRPDIRMAPPLLIFFFFFFFWGGGGGRVNASVNNSSCHVWTEPPFPVH